MKEVYLLWESYKTNKLLAIGVLKPVGISINPMLASLAMVLSSITVILNTLRLRNVKF